MILVKYAEREMMKKPKMIRMKMYFVFTTEYSFKYKNTSI